MPARRARRGWVTLTSLSWKRANAFIALPSSRASLQSQRLMKETRWLRRNPMCIRAPSPSASGNASLSNKSSANSMMLGKSHAVRSARSRISSTESSCAARSCAVKFFGSASKPWLLPAVPPGAGSATLNAAPSSARSTSAVCCCLSQSSSADMVAARLFRARARNLERMRAQKARKIGFRRIVVGVHLRLSTRLRAGSRCLRASSRTRLSTYGSTTPIFACAGSGVCMQQR
mmetsp:Transcript_6216/g.17362  ORF Transcript_6216/g.17362 Transcript_6216/m.17362 type:complete len:232 (+) Transcript_6216:1576-2271(+)